MTAKTIVVLHCQYLTKSYCSLTKVMTNNKIFTSKTTFISPTRILCKKQWDAGKSQTAKYLTKQTPWNGSSWSTESGFRTYLACKAGLRARLSLLHCIVRSTCTGLHQWRRCYSGSEWSQRRWCHAGSRERGLTDIRTSHASKAAIIVLKLMFILCRITWVSSLYQVMWGVLEPAHVSVTSEPTTE